MANNGPSRLTSFTTGSWMMYISEICFRLLVQLNLHIAIVPAAAVFVFTLGVLVYLHFY